VKNLGGGAIYWKVYRNGILIEELRRIFI